MTSQNKTGTHPFYIGMYIHIYTHIYVHIYTSQKECLCIFFPETRHTCSPKRGKGSPLGPGLVNGSKEVFIGKRGDQETATGTSHQLGYLFRLQDMGHALLIFIGTPIVEWSLVTGRSGLGQQMDGVDLRSCLDVASLKLCDVVLVPECPLHIGKRLGIS